MVIGNVTGAAGIFIQDADMFLECRLLIAHPNRPSGHRGLDGRNRN